MKLLGALSSCTVALVGFLASCQQQQAVNAFSVVLQQQQTNNKLKTVPSIRGNSALHMTTNRRDFLAQQSTAVVAAAIAGASTAVVVFPTTTASAATSGASKVNAKLAAYGLPPVAPVPDGFSSLLEIYGKGKNRTPLLVTFNHPLSWVVTLPSNTVNGEDGTVQAGDYGKGDTATLFVDSNGSYTGDITKAPKEVFESVLKKSIGQRGDNMYQNFKITKLEPGTGTNYYGDQTYMTCDFKYQLLTGAGFEVDRKGVASVTNQGKNTIEVLWAASTAARFKKTEKTLRDIVSSFRCYADGINMSSELVTFDEAI